MSDFGQSEHEAGHAHAHGPSQAPQQSGAALDQSASARGQSDELVAASPTPTAGKPYVVAAGDTLGRIAGRELGDARRWQEIYAANRAVLGANPDVIHVGARIVIPSQGGEVTGDAGRAATGPGASNTGPGASNTGPGASGTGTEGNGTGTAAAGKVEGGLVDAGVVAGPEPVKPTEPPTDPAVAGEPAFPSVSLRTGDAGTPAFLTQDRARVSLALGRWNQPFDPKWVSTHTFEPGKVGVVLAWQSAWGAETTTQDYAGSTSPLEARLAISAAQASPGWGSLDAADAPRLTGLLGGETNPQSVLARSVFYGFWSDPGWATQPAEAQANLLSGIVNDKAARPYLAESPEAAKPLPYTLTGPTLVPAHPFRGVDADADRYEVEVAGVTVPIFAPHAPDAAQGSFHSVDELARAFASLATPNRAVVNSLTLNAAQNPDDAYWAVEYNDAGFRSYMTAGAAGDITIYPTAGATPAQAEVNSSMGHETGHTWSKQTWGEDTTAAGWAPWRDAVTSDGISLSNYATSSLDEDVAETVKVYGDFKGTPMHDEYRAMVPARFAILDGYF